jgi:hypothetical protein
MSPSWSDAGWPSQMTTPSGPIRYACGMPPPPYALRSFARPTGYVIPCSRMNGWTFSGSSSLIARIRSPFFS